MSTTFSAVLGELIDRHYPSRRQFLIAVDPGSASSSTAAAYLSQVIHELRPAPLERIEAWADALHLAKGSLERQRFLDLAAITHLPAAVRPRFMEILDLLDGSGVAEVGRQAADRKSRYRTEPADDA